MRLQPLDAAALAGVEAVAEKVSSTVIKVAEEVGAKVEQLVEVVDDNILDYCTLDKAVRPCHGSQLGSIGPSDFTSAQTPAWSEARVRLRCKSLPDTFPVCAGPAAKGKKDSGRKRGGVSRSAAGEPNAELRSAKLAVLLSEVASGRPAVEVCCDILCPGEH